MALFGKKKKLVSAAKAAEIERKRELVKIINERGGFKLPGRSVTTVHSKEYTQFLKDIRPVPDSPYEKACAFTQKMISIRPGEKAKKMEEDIVTAYLNVSYSGVMSLTLISLIITMLAGFAIAMLGAGTFAMVMVMFGAGISYYIYNYPSYRSRTITSRMSANSILAVLYMIIYMRSSPNLAGALKFASENLRGPISWDLKKLLWDLELGKYLTADDAIGTYADRWRDMNPEFSEALNLLRSTAVSPERREKLFDETIDLVLNGTKERTKHYVSGLRMPVMLIHAMGVLLPVMGLVLFPIILIFMSDTVKPIFLFLGYDVFLPLFLWFFIDYILRTRPPTFSQPDITLVKGIPQMGRFKVGETTMPILPLALLVSLPLMLFSLYSIWPCLFESASCGAGGFDAVSMSVLFTLSLGLGIAVYCFLDSSQKMKIRGDIEKIENEFSVALFQLGNQLSSGVPIELSLDKATANLRDTKIAKLFATASMNMRKFGLTFEQAFFDNRVGAVWLYPSVLVRSIMTTLVEASKKGLATASAAMMTVSRYLKGIHDVKEDVSEILGETVTSMKFLAMFLTPLVAGVTITMAVIIIQILASLGSQITTLVGQGGGEMSSLQYGFMLGPGLLGGKLPIGPAAFQMIVGIYMIETIIILSVFVNRIEYGEDDIGLRRTLATSLLIGTLIYIASWLVTYSMFGNSITSLLTPAVV